MKHKLFLLFVAIISTYAAQAQNHHNLNKKPLKSQIHDGKQSYFTLNLKAGDKLANIYSRTIAYSGDDFAPVVNRVSGSSSYTVIKADPMFPVFTETDLYDGRKPSTGTSKLGINGDNEFNGKPYKNTNGSGLLYNELVLGPVHNHVKPGDSWEVKITLPWELGGIGTQINTVLALDEKNQTIMLKREGSSEGFFDSDIKEINVTTNNGKKVKMGITPGTAHWIGYTSFKNGVVMSDELLVTRPVTLKSDSLSFNCRQREYILLNAMPVSEQ